MDSIKKPNRSERRDQPCFLLKDLPLPAAVAVNAFVFFTSCGRRRETPASELNRFCSIGETD